MSNQMLSDSARLAQILGITPENIVPALYEVLPWSWLLDYFTNTGDIINAACISQKSVRYVVESVKLQTVLTITTAPDTGRTFARLGAFGFPLRNSMQGSPGSVTIQVTNITRSPISTLPIPTFSVRSPFEAPGKVANMVAVLWQRKSSLPSF